MEKAKILSIIAIAAASLGGLYCAAGSGYNAYCQRSAKRDYDPDWRNPTTAGGSTQLGLYIQDGNVDMALWIIDNHWPIPCPEETLFIAEESLCAPVLTRLLEKGLDPNMRDEFDGLSPLHWSILRRGHTDMTHILLRFGADPDLKPLPGRISHAYVGDNETAYEVAIRYGRTDAVKYMDEARAKKSTPEQADAAKKMDTQIDEPQKKQGSLAWVM